MARATKAEIKRRETELFKLTLRGGFEGDILDYAVNEYGISESSAYKYISKVYERLEEHSKIIRDRELGKALGRLAELYQMSYKLHDFKVCLAVQKEINALLGLYAPEKTQTESKVEVTINRVTTKAPHGDS